MVKKAGIISIMAAIFLTQQIAAQQDSINTKNEYIVYSVAVNIVPDGFKPPLIGFVNIAKGNHSGIQAGFINYNHKDFRGLQASYINTISGKGQGVQAGFINTTASSYKGVQAGFVNTTVESYKGIQAGFVNTCGSDKEGVQLGFVNTTAKTHKGPQIGYINISGGAKTGIQAGFINKSRSLKGVQLGFINYADSLEDGVAIGLLSIIKKNGFQAVEIGLGEAYPYNISVKMGVKKFYTCLMASHNNKLENSFSVGLGFGTHIPLYNSLFLNPEIISMSSIGSNYVQTTALALRFGHEIVKNVYLVAGPTINWHQGDYEFDIKRPFLPIVEHRINNKNSLIMGGRIGIVFDLSNAFSKL